MIISCPCKNCKLRSLHCHSTCTGYAAYRAELAAHKDKEKAMKDYDNFSFAVKKALMKKGADRMYYSANKKPR